MNIKALSHGRFLSVFMSPITRAFMHLDVRSGLVATKLAPGGILPYRYVPPQKVATVGVSLLL